MSHDPLIEQICKIVNLLGEFPVFSHTSHAAFETQMHHPLIDTQLVRQIVFVHSVIRRNRVSHSFDQKALVVRNHVVP